MKRLYIALAILAIIFATTLYNAHFLNRFTTDVTQFLSEAEKKVAAGDWAAARELTDEARAVWENHTLYLHILLRHNDTDDVFIGFQEISRLLSTGEEAEYRSVNARLMAEVSLLYEAEQFSLKNVL